MYSLFQTSKGIQARDRTIVELKEEDTFNVIIVITTAWDGSPVTIKPQLEKGTSATAYTPYVADIEAVKVRAQGKNLIPFSYRGRKETYDGITFTVNDDGSITADGTATDRAQFLIYPSSLTTLPLKAGTYTLSGCPQGGGDETYGVWSSKGQDHGKGKTFTLTEDTEMFLNITIMAGATVNNLTFYPQIEIGESATDYEPYIEPIEYERGEVIKSIYPSTTLTTDTVGALIEVEYNRDINKAFAELQRAIISLGGNV
jgi:hypothetical protein